MSDGFMNESPSEIWNELNLNKFLLIRNKQMLLPHCYR